MKRFLPNYYINCIDVWLFSYGMKGRKSFRSVLTTLAGHHNIVY